VIRRTGPFHTLSTNLPRLQERDDTAKAADSVSQKASLYAANRANEAVGVHAAATLHARRHGPLKEPDCGVSYKGCLSFRWSDTRD
jgi:hypothetical protein